MANNPNVSQHQRQSRSQSLHQIKRLINEPTRSELRYSQLSPPPMTELEFWAALVADYPQTAQRLPTLTSNKIQGGVPPPLRGVVWPSLAGARDATLLEEFHRLTGESSPYNDLIGKDIGRSFPNVEMFRDPDGEGQQMLARVLQCFSLYDTKIGYCQGLGFVVGPLLMHMTDAEAFCVLVRYDILPPPKIAFPNPCAGSWTTTISAHATYPISLGFISMSISSRTSWHGTDPPSSSTWKR